MPANLRRLTNIGTFRAYVQAYLQAHPWHHQGMTLMVRMLEPTAEGVPLSCACFTATTAWVQYEAIQGDIFDHLLALLPEFDLRLYQSPTAGTSAAGCSKRACHDSGSTGVPPVRTTMPARRRRSRRCLNWGCLPITPVQQAPDASYFELDGWATKPMRVRPAACAASMTSTTRP